MTTKSNVRFIEDLRPDRMRIDIQAVCPHPLVPHRKFTAIIGLPHDATQFQKQEAREAVRDAVLADCERAGAGVVCRMLVQWAEHGGDAPEMLIDCVNAARRALGMKGEWRPGE